MVTKQPKSDTDSDEKHVDFDMTQLLKNTTAALEIDDNTESIAATAMEEDLVRDAEGTTLVANPGTVAEKFQGTPREAIVSEPTAGLDALGRQRVIGLRTTGAGVNPKDRIGASKVDLTLIPGVAKIALAKALMEGATKYGAYNWRVEPIQMRTYIRAAMSHLDALLDGEDDARDSAIEHLGHVMANAAIILDAIAQGTIIDDRPLPGRTADYQELSNRWIATDKPEGWGR